VAALEIASALADIGVPVWLPALKLWARSAGPIAVGVCAAGPMGLPALGAGVAVGASMPAETLGMSAPLMLDLRAEVDRGPDDALGTPGAVALGVLLAAVTAGAVGVGVLLAAVTPGVAGGVGAATGVGVLAEVGPDGVGATGLPGLRGAVGVGVFAVGEAAIGAVAPDGELAPSVGMAGAALGGAIAMGVFGLVGSVEFGSAPAVGLLGWPSLTRICSSRF
jgi:hypothetical protein